MLTVEPLATLDPSVVVAEKDVVELSRGAVEEAFDGCADPEGTEAREVLSEAELPVDIVEAVPLDTTVLDELLGDDVAAAD